MITILIEETKESMKSYADEEKFLEEFNSIMLEDVFGQKIKLSEILKVD